MSSVSGLWGFTDHVCRECLDRIMLRLDGPLAGQLHRCSGCGAEANGNVEWLCACGAQYRNHPKVSTKLRGKNMGFRCIKNPKRSGDFPAEIVVQPTTETDNGGDANIRQIQAPLRQF